MTDFQCISAPLRPGNFEPVEIAIDLIDHRAGVALLCEGFDIGPEDWPDGYGVSNEIVTLSTHQGTHIDAPLHYGPGGGDIAAADIGNFMGRAVIFADLEGFGDAVRFDFDAYCAKLDRWAREANAVFFVTGAWRRYGQASYFRDFKGVPVEYVAAALDRGYGLIGTDAFSLDPPFAVMARAFEATRDPSTLWPAHVLGRRRPYYQIERLCALEDFEDAELVEYIALPVKLHCGAAWTRRGEETGVTPLFIENASAVSPLGRSLDEIWRSVLNGDVAHGEVELPGRRRFAAAPSAPGATSDVEAYAPLFFETLRKLLCDLDAPEPVDALYLATAVGHLGEIEAQVYAGRPIPVERLDFAGIRRELSGLACIGAKTRFVCVPTGCCAGLQALGLAKATMSRLGARRAIVAAIDFGLTPLAFEAFARIRALAPPGAAATSPSRPFCADRNGFLFADGGGAALVSTQPGAGSPTFERPAARIAGYGCMSSAFHMTDICADGRSIRASIETALRDAGRSASEIGHVDAHGSGTRQNDTAEYRALSDLLGPRLPPITAFKGHHGHALAGANLIEVALCWKMMLEDVSPPTPAGLAVDAFDGVPPRVAPTPFGADVLLKTASGFGGIHAALVMERGDARHLDG
jgi:3-oxoacyl-[acyl-carrier-protein] synthase II